MAEGPRVTGSFTEAVSCRECAGPRPVHSSQKGERAKGGISSAGGILNAGGERKGVGQQALQAGRKKEWQGRKRPAGGPSRLGKGRVDPSEPRL